MMNLDTFEGLWLQARELAREWWGELTEDDLERIGSEEDRLLAALQERYGWTRKRAEEELMTRLHYYEVQP